MSNIELSSRFLITLGLIMTYFVPDNDLFCIGPDLTIRRCVQEDEMTEILCGCHDGPYGGHFSDKWTAYKVFHSSYYWLSIFKDAFRYVRGCDSF